MSEPRFFHSLRFYIVVGILAPLLVAVAILSYVRHISYQNLLLQRLQHSASGVGQLIQRSLRHAMLANDRESVRQTIDELGGQVDIAALYLLDAQGRVAFSAGGPPVGATMELASTTCQVCHGQAVTSHSGSVTVTTGPKTRAFRNVNAIDNAPECYGCHSSSIPVLGVLVSDLALDSTEAALAVERRNSLVWTIAVLLVILLVVDLMINRLVLRWLDRLVRAIQRLTSGDLSVQLDGDSPDEYRVLAHAFNAMAEDISIKRHLEQQLVEKTAILENQTVRLATLNAVATTVGQSLDLEQVLHDALGEVLAVTGSRVGWVFLINETDGGQRLAAYRGDTEGPDAAETACIADHCEAWESLDSGRPRLFPAGDETPPPDIPPCLARYKAGICVPLKAGDRVLGVMALAGDISKIDPQSTPELVDTLGAIGRQIGVAVEKARLYEALRQREERQRQLLERLITVQEDERRRIARELHDQTGQPLSSLIMILDLLNKPGISPDLNRERLQDLRRVATLILDQVHELALELRPSILDDLGLLAALRNICKEYQQRFDLHVDFRDSGMQDKRLPPDVETALYRIAQEALTNIARHAEAHNVGVLLQNRGDSIVLLIEDDGKGFAVETIMGGRRLERNLGLYGMEERANLVGGSFRIESTIGKGSAVFVEIPFERGARDEENPHSVSR